MLRKIICLVLSAVMICLCSCSSGSKGGSSSDAADANVPTIELPSLPASVSAYGGTISVTEITVKDDYNESNKTISASVSMKLESAENGSSSPCKINFKVVNENGLAMDTGYMGSGEDFSVGDTYSGDIVLTNVQAGKKYKLILLGN